MNFLIFFLRKYLSNKYYFHPHNLEIYVHFLLFDDDILNLIQYNEELIRLYGKPKKDIQKVKVNYDKFISCDHGIYNYITEIKLITNSITIQDLIEEKLVYWISGYYKLYINKNTEILNIAEIYSDYRQKKPNKIRY